jgi:hypothetical protein
MSTRLSDRNMATPISLRPELLAKLRPEIERLSKIERAGVQAFVLRMKSTYPGLVPELRSQKDERLTAQ